MRMELWVASVSGRFYSKATNVSCWHFAAFAAPQNLGRYRTNSGQRGVRGLNC